MGLFDTLLKRCGSKCELCGNTTNLTLFEVQPVSKVDENSALVLCEVCHDQATHPQNIKKNRWHCLNESMWSEHLPVQVMAWRMLHELRQEGWAQDLFEQLTLDEDALIWARAGLPAEEETDASVPTLDNYGTRLMEGDSVTLIKDLDVKGGGFTAKRGTLVKNISLTNNPKHIEGQVNGIQIVLISAYLKKA